MTKREYASRNIGLTFDFLKHLIDHPEIVDTIPDGAELDFIDKDVPCKGIERFKRKKVARYRIEHLFEPIKS